MKPPSFWKLSMGNIDFTDYLEVLDWLRQGLVLVHSRCKKKAFARESQGAHFIHADRDGDYFYLCHGNRTKTHPRRGIILLGRFEGPVVEVTHHLWTDDDGWAGRRFEWIKTATTPQKYTGRHRQWAPRDNSTFIRVPDRELQEFQDEILTPYFGTTLAQLGLQSVAVA